MILATLPALAHPNPPAQRYSTSLGFVATAAGCAHYLSNAMVAEYSCKVELREPLEALQKGRVPMA